VLNSIKKLSRYKIDEKTEDDSFAIATNITVLTIKPIDISYGLIGYFLFDSGWVLFFYLLFVALHAFVIYLNSLGKYTTAKFVTIIVAYANVLNGGLIYGVKSGAEWYYYLIAILPFIIFNFKQQKQIFISILLVVPFYILNQYLYTIIDHFPLKDSTVTLLYNSVFFSLLTSILSVIYLMRRTFAKLKVQIENSNKKLAKLKKSTQDNINYASLIQNAILPQKDIFDEFFDDSFVFWRPKDTVGGDIYIAQKLNDNEVLIMVIDGAGHGVSGAFITMLVKAIEAQITAEIKAGTLNPDPSIIL